MRDEREQASPILRASDSLRPPRTEAGRRVSAVLGGFFTPSILGVWLSCQDPSETILSFGLKGRESIDSGFQKDIALLAASTVAMLLTA